MANVQGTDAFGRPSAVFAEARDDARVLVSTPPAGVLLDWAQLDQLITMLVVLRRAMPGQPQPRGGDGR